MAYDFNGTNQYLSVGSAIKSSTPLSFSYRFYPVANANSNAIVEIGNAARTQIFYAFLASSSTNLRTLHLPGTAPYAENSNATDNAWHHGASVFSANNNRSGYLNNSKVTNTTNASSVTATATSIGGNAAGSDLFAGVIAEVAIWGVALTDAEVASLNRGFKASRIRPQSLLFYAPLIRDITDCKGGFTITNNNSTTVANHPRVY